MTDAPRHTPRRPTRRCPRWRAVVPATLGLSLVTGFGAAATSAAWTDDAQFSGSASAASIDLRGSSDGATWSAADTTGTAVTLDAVTGLTPDAPVERTLHLWNASSVPLTLAWADDNPTTLYDGCVEVAYSPLPTSPVPGDPATAGGASLTTATVTFSVAADADPATCGGRTGESIDVVVRGSTA